MGPIFHRSRRGHLLAWAAIPAAIGLGTFTLHSRHSSQSAQIPPPLESTSPAQAHSRLAISPDPIVLDVADGEALAEASLNVRNLLGESVTIERIETSCPCISIDGTPIRLDPNEATDLNVALDPSDDLDFEGRLSVRVTGYLNDGRIGFQSRVNIEASSREGWLKD